MNTHEEPQTARSRSRKPPAAPGATRTRRAPRAARGMALRGFLLYAVFAPHSIAGAWVGLSLVALGWVVRTLATKRAGFERTALDLPLWLFFAWTVCSALLSAEPRISLLKLASASVFLVYYLVQATLTRSAVVPLAALLIISGTAGALWSVGEVARGRGIVVEALADNTPLRTATPLREGDAIWRAGGRRIASVAELDEAFRRTPVGGRLSLSVITQGEHVEWPGPVVTDELKARASPSGVTGGGRTHRFRASGWTRHYETFAETLQILAQLALGFAFANLQRKRSRLKVVLPAAAFALLGAGIALTAMRTVLVAFAIGAGVVVWRATARGTARLAVSLVIILALSLGALAVWRTRAGGALLFQDASPSLRWRVARVVLERIPQHPVFGHGMDAMHRHWEEWGFPGADMLHAHSTPLQIAFDRGLPALALWLWMLAAFWLILARAEKDWRTSEDAGAHGFLLGVTGALSGFAASSLVNYNFGDAEVALMLWWLMGAVVRTASSK